MGVCPTGTTTSSVRPDSTNGWLWPGCEDGGVTRVKFRHNSAIAVAGFVACFGTVPLATARWYLAPILLVPLAIGVWGIRAGTDADESGVSVRALVGRRLLPWGQITGFGYLRRGVGATLADGSTVPLPGVAAGDLPRLVEAGGQQLAGREERAEEAEDEEPAAGEQQAAQ